ncbi:hypothetical protein AYM40_12055 [Paraburkholderia phytofirmans OLGA172]|uniref:Outer membrane lipoprotein-sorting protein n=1 Tax=Paraburkholderia phytofirmans OLGA172 TaxID=1417228 RepID=A0A160FKS6_9BURK|nr:DUF1329 domain-containing protein [Paraburkholderia phytofirmans]ANB73015.1 hypothetical protein AYM40_12055 [Paraburkholderia phytofirmans OLGA172]
MKIRSAALLMALCGLVGASQLAVGAVSADEAAKLKSTLTPFGAEKAGNKSGTIPAWDGGYTQAPPGYKSGDQLPDPFASEKPLYSITAKNVDQYADKLTDGTKALLKKYPDTFRLDVYPTHRTAAAPQWVYDNTFKNATNCKTKEGGNALEGCYGGIPFPVPTNGVEAMWNHRLIWAGETTSLNVANYIGTANGHLELAVKTYNKGTYPYYDKNGSVDTFKGNSQMLRVFMTDPPFKAGEQFLAVDSVDQPRQAWQYLTGQRRVRMAPTIGYDTPDDVNSGTNYYDEAFTFWGPLDRYDWKLIGKKEMYIPYNDNKFFERGKKIEELLTPRHHNPDAVRWELHRVWVVEATLAPGKRHAVPKRRFYLDEDTWGAVLGDGYDANGQLWRVEMALPFIVPEGPMVLPNANFSLYNLTTGTYLASCVTDWSNPSYKYFFKVLDRLPKTFFTPEAMAGEGVR